MLHQMHLPGGIGSITVASMVGEFASILGFRDGGRGPAPATRLLASLTRLGRPGRMIAPELDSLRTLGLVGSSRRSRAGGNDHESRLSRAHSETYRRIWDDAATAVGAEIKELADGFWI